MSRLGFLQNIAVVAQEEPAKRPGGGGVRKEWNPPTGLVLRIWASGAVYPSQELVDTFDLEYKNALTTEQEEAIKAGTMEKPNMGFGFDIADSAEFGFINVGGNRCLIISPVRKDDEAGRVDLFNTTRFNEDGTPKLSVMDQGLVTFGKDFLIPKIEEIYKIIFAQPAQPAVEAKPAVPAETDSEGKVIKSARPAVEAREAIPAVEGVEYLDMVFVGQAGEGSTPWTLPTNKPIAYFPKVQSKGESKGQLTVARRENPQMYVLIPKIWLDEEKAQANGSTMDPGTSASN